MIVALCTGQPDGTPGAEPMKVGVAFADIFTGLYATIGILGALQLWALNLPLNKPILLTNGAQLINGSGNSYLLAPVTVLGSNYFNIAATSLTLSNAVTGAGTALPGGGEG